ncbi:hypothetical protein BV25DRAFT_1991583 [Artomyces pyxidatus]|uniref:Uncharacterized protein n=1 Tax=Artomyces pyxidatus TaxID=48021 RepID=A0ACB8T2C4_9AGAM|nr:hypothetical protein BV25DRAFT_1991583 [Artomyces pyxidatus]
MRALRRCLNNFSLPRHSAVRALSTVQPSASSPPNLSNNPHSPSDLDTPAQRHETWMRGNAIFFSTKRLLLRGRTDEAVAYFRLRLASTTASDDRVLRFRVYQRVIDLLLSQGHYPQAQELVSSMREEGLWASSVLRSKMLVASYLSSADPNHASRSDALIAALRPILSLSSFTEKELRKLVDFMNTLPRLDVKLIARVADLYVEARGEGYSLRSATINRLISVYAVRDSTEAVRFLPATPEDHPPLDDEEGTSVSAYTTLLAELSREGNLSPERVQAIVQRMNDQGIQPDLPLLNTLIRISVYQQEFYKAFAIYDLIRTNPSASMVPDAYAFSSLFKALQAMHYRRSAQTRRMKIPSNARTGRVLYREMVEYHMLETCGVIRRRSPVITTSSLNVVLRFFMLTQDYCAAYVVLGGFRAFHIGLDVKSFKVVVVALLARIRTELSVPPPKRGSRWIDRLLGWNVAKDLQAQELPSEMIDNFLHIPSQTLSSSDADPTGMKSFYRVPSSYAILQQVEPHRRTKWDIEPLERLVASAALADLEKRGTKPTEDVARAVDLAMGEILPELTPEVEENLLDLRHQRSAQDRMLRRRKLLEGKKAHRRNVLAIQALRSRRLLEVNTSATVVGGGTRKGRRHRVTTSI